MQGLLQFVTCAGRQCHWLRQACTELSHYTCNMKPCSPAQEGDRAAAAPPPDSRGTLAGGTFTEVQQLEHHWDQLSAERKTSFAQMAALTRCADSKKRSKKEDRRTEAFGCTVASAVVLPLQAGLDVCSGTMRPAS